jgi:hypothetical protein
MSFICKTCGQEHDEWPPDQATKRPDEIWDLPAAERAARAKEGDDFCMLDETRFFIRAVLPIPLLDRGGSWGLGLWVEVSESDCRRYYQLYDVDATEEPGFAGRIANALPSFPDALGMSVHVKLGPASERPILWCQDESSDRLSLAQKRGMTDSEVHSALENKQV